MKSPSERRQELISRYPRWHTETLPQFFDKVASAHPDRPAILTTGRASTYADLRQESFALASGLVACGIAPGARIALIMANYPDFVAAKLAIARAGCIAVPINFQLRLEELLYVIGQSGCSAVIGMAEFRGRDYRADLHPLRDEVPSLEHVFIRESGASLPPGFATMTELAALGNSHSDAETVRRQEAAQADDWSDIIYTSGTTGHPKGAILTHDMVLRSAYSSALTRSFEDGRRIQFALPLYHVFGYVECWVAGLFVGGAIIPHPVFDPVEMLDTADRLQATDMICVPMMTHALLDAARARARGPSALLAYFNSGGTNVPTVWDEIRTIMGAAEIHTAYGMTETTASATCTLSEDPVERLLNTNGRYKLAGAAGAPELGGLVALYRVVEPGTDQELPLDQDGELQVRGPVVTRGYYGQPEETYAAFTADGWFRTGDIGRLLEGGYIRLTGRIKEAYRCGGEMVMPREIEDLLANFPGAAQVLAVGIPDPRMGEVGCLCIVPKPGECPDGDAMIALCAAKLAKFKVPRHTAIFGPHEIPLTATGRPQKFKLAQLAAERL